MGENFVNGTIDRLFKNSAGEYEIVVYKTCPIDDVEHAANLLTGELEAPPSGEYTTEMELYAMLVFKLFPEQQSVTTTIFFTHSGSAYSSRYDIEQLTEIEQKCLENIEQILSGKFEKNTSHCPDCFYSYEFCS